ncbi:MAG: 6-phosphogluconolactonase [Acidobacteriia bacterium]|nr:6-phosphogluconolactonase [Terriglobia bacterium]
MSAHRYTYPDAQKAAQACARNIMVRLEEALSGQQYATLAISGGNSPKPIFHAMVEARLDWSRVHLFWVDERCVPPTDPQSNFRMAEEALIHPAHIPHRNIHRIQGELRPDDSAAHYAAGIRSFFGLAAGELPHFDIIHFGIGADGHTASLFPGEPLIEDRTGIAAAVYVEKMTQYRVTLLPGVLLAAKHNIVFVTGAEKAETIRAILEDAYNPQLYPAQITSHHGRAVTWFMDDAAASLLS